MKYLYLISAQFSKFFIRESIIIIQIFILIFAFNIAMNPIMYSISANKAIISGLNENAIYFWPHNRVAEKIMFSEFEESRQLRELLDNDLGKHESIKGQGQVYIGTASIGNIDNITILLYNDDLIRNSKLNLYKGRQLSDSYQSDIIPIILSYNLGKEKAIDDIIEITIFNPESDHVTLNTQLSGVMEKDGFAYNISSAGSIPDIESLTFVDENVMIVPLSRVTRKIYTECTENAGGRILFLSQDSIVDKEIERLNNSMNKYGTFVSIETMYNNQLGRICRAFNNEFIISFVAFFMLLFGITGYLLLIHLNHEKETGIYLICGMSKRDMKRIYILQVAIVVIPALILALITSNIYILKYSHSIHISLINPTTQVLSVLSVLLVATFALAVAFNRIKKVNILNLFRRGL
ncbi:MAG: FtsX-like permease family protein [Clostridiaceae bacterium]|nr:FtsX-like permease family protein [Clostridiaceae bacterium]